MRPKPFNKGCFISFEGVDGSGKSTQADLLYRHLEKRGYSTVFVREPGGTRISNLLRQLLLDPNLTETDPHTEALLYIASRAQLVKEIILPALGQNSIVISDRYFHSTLAYQGYGRGLEMKEIRRINDWATDGLRPDLTFLIDLDIQEGLRRATHGFTDRIEAEEADFHQKIRQGFLELAQVERDYVCLISGTSSQQQIHLEVLKELRKRYPDESI